MEFKSEELEEQFKQGKERNISSYGAGVYRFYVY